MQTYNIHKNCIDRCYNQKSCTRWIDLSCMTLAPNYSMVHLPPSRSMNRFTLRWQSPRSMYGIIAYTEAALARRRLTSSLVIRALCYCPFASLSDLRLVGSLFLWRNALPTSQTSFATLNHVCLKTSSPVSPDSSPIANLLLDGRTGPSATIPFPDIPLYI